MARDLNEPGTRVVHCEEAVGWLAARPSFDGCSFITSLPDVSETPLLLLEWKRWFVGAAEAILKRCPDDGVAMFYQTDIKVDGTWVDKGYLCHQAAEAAGSRLLWHKIVCRKEPGVATFGRPSYAHLLCYSRGLRPDPSRATADVLPRTGEMTWSRAMGVDVCRFAARFVRQHTSSRKVVDPFCGYGTVLAAANELGLDAEGVELCRRRARRARGLTLRPASDSAAAAVTVPARTGSGSGA